MLSDLGKLRRVTGFVARSRSWTAALMCGPQRASYRRVGFRSQPRWTSTPGQNSRSCGTTSPRLARHPDQCWGPLARRPEDTSWAPARTSRPTARSSWVSTGGVVERAAAYARSTGLRSHAVYRSSTANLQVQIGMGPWWAASNVLPQRQRTTSALRDRDTRACRDRPCADLSVSRYCVT